MEARFFSDRLVENRRGTRHFRGRTPLDGEPMSQKAMGGISKVKSWVKKKAFEQPNNTKYKNFINLKQKKFTPKANHSSHLFLDRGLKEGRLYAMYDIKSAFPNIALVYGLINNDIHSYLMDIPNKVERLACLGASSSDKIEYKISREGEKHSPKHTEAISIGFFNCILSALDDWTIQNVIKKDRYSICKAIYMDAIFIEINKSNVEKVLHFINSVNAVDKEVQFIPKNVYRMIKTEKIIGYRNEPRFLTTFEKPNGKEKAYLFQNPEKSLH